MCISSVQQLNRNSIEFSLSTQTRSSSKALQSKFLQWHALTKLRAEIEKRKERVCQECKRFGYLVHNCRNRKEEMKGKPISQNEFEVIKSRIMQCRVREEVRRQETGEKKVQCFRCWRIKHYKQQCSNIKVEKERKGGQEVVCVVNPQKAQQVKKLVHFLWRKVQKYSSVQDMPLRSVALEERGWKTRQEVVTFVEYSGCNYKGTKTEENQGQDFVSREVK